MQSTPASAPTASASTPPVPVDRAAYHGAPLTVFVEREPRSSAIAVHVQAVSAPVAPRALPQGEELFELSAAMF